MILETGMFLCWMSIGVQHCGKLGEHDIFREDSLTIGAPQLACSDGNLPHLERKFGDIIGLYEATCFDGKSRTDPLRTTVEWPGLSGRALTEYNRMIDEARAEWGKVQMWWHDHPQCKHTTAWSGGGIEQKGSGSTEDLSGSATGDEYTSEKGLPGLCVLDGKSEGRHFWPPGSEDTTRIERYDPDSQFVKDNRRAQAAAYR